MLCKKNIIPEEINHLYVITEFLCTQESLQRLTKGISTQVSAASSPSISTFFVQSTRGSTNLSWMCVKRLVSNSGLCVFPLIQQIKSAGLKLLNVVDYH